MARMFRLLRADEIECRVATVTEKGCSLLLYKDARCDQNILDETVGAMNWQNKYTRDNANCAVGIFDHEKKEWIWKENTGTESFTEKEKGLASDSFKRACFNWGIGRELYTAPFIWIPAKYVEIKPGKNGKLTTYDKFDLHAIGYDDNETVNHLIITKKGRPVFKFGETARTDTELPETDEQADDAGLDEVIDEKELQRLNATLNDEWATWALETFKVADLSHLTKRQYAEIFRLLNERRKANGKQSKAS